MENGASPEAAAAVFLMAFLGIILILAAAGYIYKSICLQLIAKKTNTPNAWLAWIPIADMFLMCSIGKKSYWWVLLMYVPIVNIIFFILLWMEISKARGKEDWLGILMILPLVQIFIIGYLAFSK